MNLLVFKGVETKVQIDKMSSHEILVVSMIEMLGYEYYKLLVDKYNIKFKGELKAFFDSYFVNPPTS